MRTVKNAAQAALALAPNTDASEGFKVLSDAEVAALPVEGQLAYMRAYNAHLKSEADNAKAKAARKVSVKVYSEETTDKKTGEKKSPTFAIGVIGLGRFPTVLYKSQWEALFKACGITETPDLFKQAFAHPGVLENEKKHNADS